MSDNLPVPAWWETMLAMLSDAASQVFRIPGAVKAISRLVTGLADAGTAWTDVAKASGEQRAQLIRDETAARSAMTSAVLKQATKQVGKNPEVVDNAISVWVADRLRKQANRNSVALLTVQQLQDDPPAVVPETSPDDDWLNVFEMHVENATSERLQNLWARVLAGEIRKPGSFSLRTLQFISTIDQELAKHIMAVVPYLFNKSVIPTIDRFTRGEDYGRLVRLTEAGFLVLGSSMQYRVTEDGSISFPVGGKLGVEFKGQPGRNMTITGAIITSVGQELLGVMAIEDDLQTVTLLAAEVAKANNMTMTAQSSPLSLDIRQG